MTTNGGPRMLDGWKEIARYIGTKRGSTPHWKTVRRWSESEKPLPVSRFKLNRLGKGRVQTSTDRVDAWLWEITNG